jgi:hypothetical protein
MCYTWGITRFAETDFEFRISDFGFWIAQSKEIDITFTRQQV